MWRKQLSTESNRKVICLGDFNTTTSTAWYNSSLRELFEGIEVNNNGERIRNFFNTQKLSVLNTWFSHKNCRRIAWYFPDGTTTKIYDFKLSCSWLRKFVKNYRVYNSYDFDSDHRLDIAKMKTPSKKQQDSERDIRKPNRKS